MVGSLATSCRKPQDENTIVIIMRSREVQVSVTERTHDMYQAEAPKSLTKFVDELYQHSIGIQSDRDPKNPERTLSYWDPGSRLQRWCEELYDEAVADPLPSFFGPVHGPKKKAGVTGMVQWVPTLAIPFKNVFTYKTAHLNGRLIRYCSAASEGLDAKLAGLVKDDVAHNMPVARRLFRLCRALRHVQALDGSVCKAALQQFATESHQLQLFEPKKWVNDDKTSRANSRGGMSREGSGSMPMTEGHNPTVADRWNKEVTSIIEPALVDHGELLYVPSWRAVLDGAITDYQVYLCTEYHQAGSSEPAPPTDTSSRGKRGRLGCYDDGDDDDDDDDGDEVLVTHLSPSRFAHVRDPDDDAPYDEDAHDEGNEGSSSQYDEEELTSSTEKWANGWDIFPNGTVPSDESPAAAEAESAPKSKKKSAEKTN